MADESDVLVDELSAEALLEAARCAIRTWSESCDTGTGIVLKNVSC